MSKTAKLKKKATDLEQKKQFDKALQLYVQLLDEAGRDLDDADLQLYNRVGDLLMRQGNTTEALTYYEKAVDVYAERGFLNNAIALCSKILRQSPARTAVYYKLGKISANKGFKSDAKKNFLEYADRMEKAGQRNEAFRALKEFADLCPDQDDIRLMLAEMLSKDNRKDEALDQLQTLYEKLEGEGRGAEARATVDRMKAIDPAVEPRASGMHLEQKSNDLVFLDLTHDLGGGALTVAGGPAISTPVAPKHVTMQEIPALEGLTLTFVPDDADGEPTNDDFALVESVEGLVSSNDSADALDADAIEALLTIPDGALATVERDAAIYAQESRHPIADLEPTAVPESEDADFLLEPLVELSGWEPTETGAPRAASTPLMAPLIEGPVLTGSEFGELALKDAEEARPTPVHDLLLPTELPLLASPSSAVPQSDPEKHTGHDDMAPVDSPSPIDTSDVAVEAGSGFDLISELTSPFARENARDAAVAEAGVATDPFGVRLQDVAPATVDDVSSAAEPWEALSDIVDPPSVALTPQLAGVSLGDADAQQTDAIPFEEMVTDEDHVLPGDEATSWAESELPVAIEQDADADPEATDSGPVSEGSDSTSASVELAASAEQHQEAVLSELTEASVEAAFESPVAEFLPPVSDSLEKGASVEAVQAAAFTDREVAADETEVLRNAPGFGDLDPEASTFSPSPRLSALTLQPDAWNSDDTPEVLIDGEWHDERVGNAAHVAPDEAHTEADRFDDLAAAMMWVPTDDNIGEGAPESGAASGDGVPPHYHTPRGHVSFGGVEEQLRRRLELVPENWAIRRQLGEALLDTGDRDAGLYELDLAMVGYELSGDLLGAMEVADGIVQLVPASVRHHQKRVEYAVRAGDRVRLVDAYMELGDALFRDGEPGMAQAVYARVLELSPGHERATFAVAALGPLADATFESPLTAALGTTDDAFAEWEPPSHVIASFVSARSGEQMAALFGPGAEAPSDTGRLGPEDAASKVATGPAAGMPADAGDLDVIRRDADAATESVAPGSSPAFSQRDQSDVRARDFLERDGTALQPSAVDRIREPLAEAAQEQGPAVAAPGSQVDPPGSPGSALDTESLKEAVEQTGQGALGGAADSGMSPRSDLTESSILLRARSMTPVGTRDDEFVDLGEWLRLTEPERTTRMVVDEAPPSGDEQADFDDMLRRFKRGVAENVDDEDFASHYDLGVAYKEMGLVDEAIAQFQRALRGESHRIKSYEALGQCFVEKGQYAVATALLQRAAETSQVDDHRLVGVLYLLGYSMEAMERRTEAMRYYQRVFAVDIEFRDVAQRVAAMEHQPT